MYAIRSYYAPGGQGLEGGQTHLDRSICVQCLQDCIRHQGVVVVAQNKQPSGAQDAADRDEEGVERRGRDVMQARNNFV